MIILITRFR